MPVTDARRRLFGLCFSPGAQASHTTLHQISSYEHSFLGSTVSTRACSGGHFEFLDF